MDGRGMGRRDEIVSEIALTKTVVRNKGVMPVGQPEIETNRLIGVYRN